MKLKFVKALLDSYDEELPVCITPTTGYNEPSEDEAEVIKVKDDYYVNTKGEVVKGKFLCIGSYL